MKRTLLHWASLFLFLFVTAAAEAQLDNGKWTFSNPKPFGFTSYQLSYADDNTALIVGVAGAIGKTTDGGATWKYFSYVTRNAAGNVTKPTFNDVQFVNSSLAFAVGSDGIMIKSIDGGINWTKLANPYFTPQLEIHTVCFLNADTGYIGGAGDPVTRKPAIYKTVNGGASWQLEYEFPEPRVEWYDPAILKIRFSPAGVGYAAGAVGLLWKYKDGVWSDYSVTPDIIYANLDINETDTMITDYGGGFIDTTVYDYSDFINGVDEQMYRALAVVNDSVVVIGAQNNGALVRVNTSDATGKYSLLNNGSLSSKNHSSLGGAQIYNLICKDGNKIFGTGGSRLYSSSDKGFTWQASEVYPQGMPESGIDFYGIDLSPSNRLGMCGQIGITADSLTQWRRPYKNVKPSLGFFSGYGIEAVSFADANFGAAAGGGGTILRTADGGDTWEDATTASFGPYDFYTDIQQMSSSVLLGTDNTGSFYKSFDRGTSFDLLFKEEHNGYIPAMHFINEDTGWLAAVINGYDEIRAVPVLYNIIYHTTDGGLTWDSSTTSFPVVEDYSVFNRLQDMKFFNGKVGYAVGDNGTIFKTTDGGITWAQQFNVPAFVADKSLLSVSVVNENVAFASGFQGPVIKTTDGGITWVLSNAGLPADNNYNEILMFDAFQGMVFGSGAVYTTLDGGESWLPYYAPVDDGFGAACFVPIANCTEGICKKVFAGGLFRGAVLKFDSDVVLPVKFSNLSGAVTSNGNQLFWTAFAQEKVKYFEIEKSADGIHFVAVGNKVYPGGLSTESYQWLDANAAAGKTYYRIKAIEITGAFFYTNVVSLSSKKAEQWSYQVSNGTLLIRNVKALPGNVTASVINAAGQKIAAKSWRQNGGAFNEFMLLPPAVRGVHFVRIENQGATYNFRVFID
ncbi:MAG: YCF48-related protein [Ferruginibacter sp.]